MKKLEPLSLDGIKTYSLSERHSKVSFPGFWQAPGGQGAASGSCGSPAQDPGGRGRAGCGRGLGSGPEGWPPRAPGHGGPPHPRWFEPRAQSISCSGV